MKPMTALWAAFFAVEAAGCVFGIANQLWYNAVFSGVLGAFLVAPLAAVAGILAAREVARGAVSLKAGARLLVSGLFLAFLGLHAPESKFVPWPYIDNCFATGFKRERFSEVRKGMSTASVEAILGSPGHLRATSWGYRLSGSPDLIWSYSSDHCGEHGDYAWRSFEVGFRSGKVIATSTAWRYD